MGFEKLKKITELILEKNKKQISLIKNSSYPINYRYLSSHKELRAQTINVLDIAENLLPDNKSYFVNIKNLINNNHFYTLYSAKKALKHIFELIEIEEVSELKIKELKIFESAEDKLEQAGLSFRNENYPSVFNNLNTALELVLKDKIGIPVTLKGINTSNVIELLVKEKTLSYQYFDEAKKRVTLIDNKIKHTGYSPSPPQCISALKAMQDLMSKLKDKEIKISEELRNKIFESLYDRKGKNKSQLRTRYSNRNNHKNRKQRT